MSRTHVVSHVTVMQIVRKERCGIFSLVEVEGEGSLQSTHERIPDKSDNHPDGFTSRGPLNRLRYSLVQLGLITEEVEERPTPRMWPASRRRKVAKKLRAIED